MKGYYTGNISDIDTEHGFVKVTFPGENDIVSEWLPLLASEYNPPNIGDFVGTIVDENYDGVCLGKIFSFKQPPEGGNSYEKNIDGIKITKNGGTFKIDFGDAYITYSGGTLTLSANKINLNGYTPPKG